MFASDTESWQEIQHCGLRNDLDTLSLETEAAAHAVHCSKRECGACSEGTQRKLSRFPIRPLLPTAPLSREPWCIKSFIVIKKNENGSCCQPFLLGSFMLRTGGVTNSMLSVTVGRSSKVSHKFPDLKKTLLHNEHGFPVHHDCVSSTYHLMEPNSLSE